MSVKTRTASQLMPEMRAYRRLATRDHIQYMAGKYPNPQSCASGVPTHEPEPTERPVPQRHAPARETVSPRASISRPPRIRVQSPRRPVEGAARKEVRRGLSECPRMRVRHRHSLPDCRPGRNARSSFGGTALVVSMQGLSRSRAKLAPTFSRNCQIDEIPFIFSCFHPS